MRRSGILLVDARCEMFGRKRQRNNDDGRIG
jgi:hypothetical protein